MTTHPIALALPFALLAVAAAAASGCDPSTSAQAASEPTWGPGTAARTPTRAEQIERGRYLVSTSGCHDCHTPWKMGERGPEPDFSRALSGHPQTLEMPPAPELPPGPWLVSASATNTAWAGPWGVSFTANLTPDRQTGLGNWNERTFIDTIRNGRHLGRGRPLLPPMPAPVYANMTDEDLAAVFAYLQSIPAISNRVPAPRPPAGGST
jgi:mono/diheme cytochrome c family protein